VLLDHGADPTIVATCPDRIRFTPSGKTAVEMAARRGRGDVVALFERRGVPVVLHGVEQLLAACARNDGARVGAIAETEPQTVAEMMVAGGTFLSAFAGVGNTDGVRHLLDLGVPITALSENGDPYFGVAKNSLALHVAAWRAQHSTVKLLVDRGSPIDVPDGAGRTALALAVRACVDSYWSYRRSPESVKILLEAGASVSGISFPSGYDDVDALLKPRITNPTGS
jgi:ankyrin repeat protein